MAKSSASKSPSPVSVVRLKSCRCTSSMPMRPRTFPHVIVPVLRFTGRGRSLLLHRCQGHGVITLVLGSHARDGPGPLLPIELAQFRAGQFTDPLTGQERKPKHVAHSIRHPVETVPEFDDLVRRQDALASFSSMDGGMPVAGLRFNKSRPIRKQRSRGQASVVCSPHSHNPHRPSGPRA